MASVPPSPAPIAALRAPILGSITNELDKIAPRFEVEADRIHIIRDPADFYAALKVWYIELEIWTQGCAHCSTGTNIEGEETSVFIHAVYRESRT
jgi:hypothetical protein